MSNMHPLPYMTYMLMCRQKPNFRDLLRAFNAEFQTYESKLQLENFKNYINVRRDNPKYPHKAWSAFDMGSYLVFLNRSMCL